MKKYTRGEKFEIVFLSIIGAIIGALVGSVFAGIIFFWFTGISDKMSDIGEEIFIAGVILAALFMLGFIIYGAIKGFKFAKNDITSGE